MAPNGSTVALVNTGGYSGNAYGGIVDVIFDEDVAATIGATPASGRFNPIGNLASLNGINPVGTWRVRYQDTTAEDPLCVYRSDLNIKLGGAGVTILQSGNGTTDIAQEGGTSTFRVVLDTRPRKDVVLDLVPQNSQISLNSAAAGASVQLTFTKNNWNTPQTVNVKAVEDLIAEIPPVVTVVETRINAATQDTAYAPLTPAQLGKATVRTLADNDVAGLNIAPQGTRRAAEDQTNSDHYQLSLNSQPTANVVVNISTGTQLRPQINTTPVTSVTFTPQNWNVAQSLKLFAVDDNIVEGEHTATTNYSVSSADPLYNNSTSGTWTTTIIDNDFLKVEFKQASHEALENTTAPRLLRLFGARVQTPLSVQVVDTGSGTAQAGVDYTYTTPQTVTIPAGDYTAGADLTLPGLNIINDDLVEGIETVNFSLNSTSPLVLLADTNNDGLIRTTQTYRILNDDVAGVTVTRSGGTNTVTEGGTEDSIQLSLRSRPSSPVTIELTPDQQLNLGQGGGVSRTIAFEPAQWNTPQTVAFTAVDDRAVEGTHEGSISLRASSADANYNNLSLANESVAITDNDAAGFTVDKSTVTVGENGGEENFGVRLSNQPLSNVEITVTVDNPAEATVSKDRLVFTPGNWNSRQDVRVQGVDDRRVEAASATVTLSVDDNASNDAFDPLADQTVGVNILEDDAAGVTVTPTDTNLSEPDDDGEFEIVLNSEPSADVTITLSSSDTSEAAVQETVTFTPANWNVVQVVPILVEDDVLGDGVVTVVIKTNDVLSSDANYDILGDEDVADVTVTVNDDPPGFRVVVESNRSSETGEAASVRIRLLSRPVAGSVTLPLSLSDETEGQLDKTSLTFPAAQWDVFQTVTITGLDDDLDDGDVLYTLVTGDPTSPDPIYDALDADDSPDIQLLNIDDDVSAVFVESSGGTLSEDGDTVTLGYRLTARPTSEVRVVLSPDGQVDLGNGAENPITLTFTPSNWNAVQEVTAVAVNDNVAEGEHSGTIIGNVDSSDPNYEGLNLDAITLNITDNEVVKILLSQSEGTTETAEGGASDTLDLRLGSKPQAPVQITLASDEDTSLDASILTFTPQNWNTTQTVTLRAVDDNVVEGEHDSAISFTVDSADGAYAAQSLTEVTNVITDNDRGQITLTGQTLTLNENGGTGSFEVILATRPIGTVGLAVAPQTGGEVTVEPTTLTFDENTWNTAQTVTVTGLDDFVDRDDTVRVEVRVDPDATVDTYDDASPQFVEVILTDDDTAGLRVTPETLEINEEGTGQEFAVSLDTQPSAGVSVQVASESGSIIFTPKTLFFTPENWNTSQNVQVTGVADDDVRDELAQLTLRAEPGSAAEYLSAGEVTRSVNVADDDIAGLSLSLPNTVGEEGSVTGSVVLDARPTGDVVLTLTSSDNDAATASPETLTFTAENWNEPQTVTLSGRGDADLVDEIVAITASVVSASSDPDFAGAEAQSVEITVQDNDEATIVVSPNEITVNENAGTESFTIVLGAQPASDVVIDLASSSSDEATLSPSLLTFTPENWNEPQTVTVTGVDDAVDRGDAATITISVNDTGSDDAFDDVADQSIDVILVDDDTFGVRIVESDGSTRVGEDGTKDTLEINLASEPTANVLVRITPDAQLDAGLGAQTPIELTFTPGNWSVAQIVEVTAVDDSRVEGTHSGLIAYGTSSNDTLYDQVVLPDTTVLVADNDTAGFSLTPETLTIDENGGTESFAVVLDREPLGNVTFALGSGAEVTLDTTRLVFTPGNWNEPQNVSVTGVDDFVDRGDTETIVVAVDPDETVAQFDNVAFRNVGVTLTDDDTAGVLVEPTEIITTEANRTPARVSVRLTSQPTEVVTVEWESSDASEATLNVDALEFDSTNWNTSQNLIVAGVDDFEDDGDVPYTIRSTTVTSLDPAYAVLTGEDVADVAGTNLDDDTAAVVVLESDQETVLSEDGDSDTVSYRLATRPTAEVTLTLRGEDQVDFAPETLTFTPTDWNRTQTVTYTARDDRRAEGEHVASVSGTVDSTDDNYNSLLVPVISVTIDDNDVAGWQIDETDGNTTVSESGVTDEIGYALTSQPAAPVRVTLVPGSEIDLGAGAGQTRTLEFTSENWNNPQVVTVAALDDAFIEDEHADAITYGFSSADSNYNGLATAQTTVTILDDDLAGFVVTPSEDKTLDEGVTNQSEYSVRLTARPTGDVFLSVTSGDGKSLRVDTPTLAFTSENWNLDQSVEFTALEDNDVVDETVVVSFQINDVASDEDFDMVPGQARTVTVIDNDSPSIVANLQNLNVNENGGTETFTVALGAQPEGRVSLLVASGSTDEARVSPETLTFNSMNWSVPQSVVVTGIDDSRVGTDSTLITVSVDSANTSDEFDSAPAATVSVTLLDDDEAGVRVTPIDTTLAEPDDDGSFEIVLTSQPTADVTIPLISSDPSEGTVVESVTFTPENWDEAQLVIVSVVDDDSADNIEEFVIVTGDADSADADYAALSGDLIDDVAMTTQNDDPPGVVVSTNGTQTSEAGGAVEVRLRLLSQPENGDVRIPLSLSDASEGILSAEEAVIPNDEWNTGQTVTVTGIDDAVADGDVTYTLLTGDPSSSDTVYDAFDETDTADILLTNLDDDVAGVRVIETEERTVVSEGGTLDTLEYRLTSQPLSEVTLTLTPDAQLNLEEGAGAQKTLSFDSQNWNEVQTVTVTAVDDETEEGVHGGVITQKVTSPDEGYDDLSLAALQVEIIDNDTAGVIVAQTDGSTTVSENNDVDTYTLVLGTRPTANVRVTATPNGELSLGDGDGVSVTKIFTPTNWRTPQTITVEAVDDRTVEGEHGGVITHTAASTDSFYDGLDIESIDVTILDNDAAGVSTNNTNFFVSEEGQTATHTTRLTSQPEAEVNLTLTPDDQIDLGAGAGVALTLNFTPQNWNQNQSVLLRAVNDDFFEGSHVGIVTRAASSADANYDGLSLEDLSATITDNDRVGVRLEVRDTLTSEDGDTGLVEFTLRSQPKDAVTIQLSSSDESEGSVPGSLVIDPSDWNTPRQVLVTGVDDLLVDGDVEYQLVTGSVTSPDPDYEAVTRTQVPDVTLTNLDNDVDGDGDLVSDEQERLDGTDAEDARSYRDTDGDLVPDAVERAQGTNPQSQEEYLDTDGGGVPDYVEEVLYPNRGLNRGDPDNPIDDRRDRDGDGVPDYIELTTGSDPRDGTNYRDGDGDQVPDYVEENENTDPQNANDYRDSDGDLVPDYIEIRTGSDRDDPLDFLDTDGDLVPDYVEQGENTDSQDAASFLDSDAGGVPDYAEVVYFPGAGLPALDRNDDSDDMRDSDGDAVPDYIELREGTDWQDRDSYRDGDGDLVPDYIETLEGTDPQDARDYRDQDRDEVPDYVEFNEGTDASDALDYADADQDLVPDYVENREGTEAGNEDSQLDGDLGGAADYIERTYLSNRGLPATDPANPADDTQDSDGDEVPDYIEIRDGTDPSDRTDYRDTDGDRVPDYVEETEGSNADDATDYRDQDRDGVPDYVERRDGTDSNNSTDYRDSDLGGAPDYIETVLFPSRGLTSGNKQDPSDDERDLDGDGVPDYVELQQGTDAQNPESYRDTDGDGVPDYVELVDNTDPSERTSYRDSDGDLVPDYVETQTGSDASDGLDYRDQDEDLVPDFVERRLENTDETDPASFLDGDGGGAANYLETVWIVQKNLPTLDPNDPSDDARDKDGDRVPDLVELRQNTDPENAQDYRDTDGDKVPDYVENTQNTDSQNPRSYRDADGDGVPDYVEERDETDPNDPNDYLDTDQDNVPDYIETVVENTDPNDGTSFRDSDAGGVSDYVETVLLVNNDLPAGNPNDPADDAKDTDTDGVPDIVELADGTDPNDASDYQDGDGDLVPDYIERDSDDGSDGTKYVDTDEDGVPDYVENRDETDPRDPADFGDRDGGGAADYIETVLLPNSGLPATDENNPDDDTRDTDGDGVPDYIEVRGGTDPQDARSYPDTDGDGVPDYVENRDGTDPNDESDYRDSDQDKVPDYVEAQNGTDPNDPNDYLDTDQDNVPDFVETVLENTDPTDAGDYLDSDGGGVADYLETTLLPNNGAAATNPNDPGDDAQDTDGDGVPDSVEFVDGTALDNPSDYLDTDGDLVPDFVEGENGTDPNDPRDYLDGDGDLVPDYVENQDGTDPNDATEFTDTDDGGAPDYVERTLFPNVGLEPTDPAKATDDSRDTDGDGVPDYVELREGTRADSAQSYLDSDEDLVPDYVETRDGTDKADAANYTDTDGDLVPDYVEDRDGTDATRTDDYLDTDGGTTPDYVEKTLWPNQGLPSTDVNDAGDDARDTDEDGVPDYVEIRQGTDPRDAQSYLDTDGDLVPDYVEQKAGTDPDDRTNYPDEDRDLVPDYVEIRDGTDPKNPLAYRDADRDIVPDYVERVLQGTDPENKNDYLDSDGGGASDYIETVYLPNRGLNRIDPNNPADDLQDSDGDTVPDYVELLNQTGVEDTEDDGDRIPTAEEYAGPNNGDANGDGIPDYAQRNVATRINSATGRYASLIVTGECEIIRDFDFVQEASLERQDERAEYFVGLHDFELECANFGDSVEVTVLWDQLYATENWVYKKYNPNTGEYRFIDDRVELSTAAVAGVEKTTSRYTLRDGGDLDTDGTANAAIIDPAGPALIAVFAGEENSGLLRTGGRTDYLPYLLALASGAAWVGWVVSRQKVLREED